MDIMSQGSFSPRQYGRIRTVDRQGQEQKYDHAVHLADAAEHNGETHSLKVSPYADRVKRRVLHHVPLPLLSSERSARRLPSRCLRRM